MSVKVTDNHFQGNFFSLDNEDPRFKIPAELSFQDGEFGFNNLTFSVSGIIGSGEHFLTVISANEFRIPQARGDN